MYNIMRRLWNKIEYLRRKSFDKYLPESEGEIIVQDILAKEDQYSLNTEKRESRIVVSLTSFPERFDNLHLVIRRLLLQTVKPDTIILYLDENIDINEKNGVLPSTLTALQQYGLIIQTRPGDIKPHKKYFYAMQEYPEDIIITVDDDILYPVNLIEELLKVHKLYPDCVVASRAHQIRWHFDGSFYPYNEWKWAYRRKCEPRMDLVATGCGGVLYPPKCLFDDYKNMRLLQKLSPTQDDLWLKVMEVLNGTRVVVASSVIRKNLSQVPGSQTKSLNAANVHENANDLFWNNLLNYYQSTLPREWR